ncbi:transcriptional regulator, TetR family [Desulfotomaculum arcticum]|uniref:Transcriptional regulator, TetR family n=1 Tax=Desulfotruncus arcticus DSM 17038 TaxID=1121424 RepID=A0A1I2V4Q7_9FIRM|nr:TetR/AcrR family transcriptional regulator [Desulfotruncus arcticus]SFG83187.1 transcriptional regulator, TetR family [Desulfotomaculum arcticum] [Desulfotruncus arcticus DSM 17038]
MHHKPDHKSTLIKLKENEREVRRNLIIDASVSLFARKPFNQVGMRDIAAEAGISPASIYRYFADRDELFVEALYREAKVIGKNLEKLLEENKNASMEKLACDFVEYLLDHDTFFQMMSHFMIDGGINETSLARFNEIERYLLNIFDESFAKIGVKENVRLVSHAFFASLNGILITFRNYPGRDKKEIRKHMLRLASITAGVFEKGAAGL